MKAKQRVLFPQWLLQVVLVYDSVLEVIVAFFVSVELVDIVFGKAVSNGVEIYGWAAALPPLMVIVYFVVMYKYFGGTIAMRLGRWLASRRYRRSS